MKNTLLSENEIKSIIEKGLIRKSIISTSDIVNKDYIENIVYSKAEEYLNKNKEVIDEVVDDKDMDNLDSEKCGKSAKYIVNSMNNAIDKFNSLYDEYEGYVKEIDEWYKKNIFEKHKKDERTTYLLDEDYEKSEEGQRVLSFTHAVENHHDLGLSRVHSILNSKDRDISIKDDIDMLLDTESYNTTEKLTEVFSDLFTLRRKINNLFSWYNTRGNNYADKVKFEDIKNAIDITYDIPGFEHQKEFIDVIEKMNVPLKSIQLNTSKLVDKLHINVTNGRGKLILLRMLDMH